jgi:FO synthase
MRGAHRSGLRSTATIMFGHVDHTSIGRDTLRISRAAQETGGFTEFVPLPFVHGSPDLSQVAPGAAPPSARQLMHAIARLALNPLITNIQTSWVKMAMMGEDVPSSGANDPAAR